MSKIYVAGHSGLLGSAVVRRLLKTGHTQLVLRTHHELDLLNLAAVSSFFEKEKPEFVFLCAARVGGILENRTHQGAFLFENVQIQNNVIDAARRFGVKKLLFVASTCIYPSRCIQPMKEDSLMTGPCEPTNEGYAIAKIAGLKLCQFYRREYGVNFIVACPTNLFGLNDNYDLDRCHLLPALIRRIHEAKSSRAESVMLWGTGKPRREFMLSDECADALVYLMQNYSAEDHINVGTGSDRSILEIAQAVAKELGYAGGFKFDVTKPDGMFQKLTDVSNLVKLGWRSQVTLEQGIQLAYADFLNRFSSQGVMKYNLQSASA